MTYYLKYRPQTLEELDQDSVRESLTKLVKSGKIPHALLFSGPKGTGKTSAARILSKIVNCESPKGNEPCNNCDQCKSISKGQNLDVIELDAASHRGIEDIRQIRDAVKLAPAKANKKVYIIDEAHMLTTEASNALLKTLEEPPDHVMFILATTNPEKLIGTIRSRVTNIVFKKATKKELVRSLEKIAKGEGVKVGDGVFEVIADASDGSFRDATKIFEQLVSEDSDFKKENVEAVLSARKTFSVSEFLDVLKKKDTRKSLELLDGALQKGAVTRDVAGLIIEELRELLLASVGLGETKSDLFEKEELIALISLFSEAYPKIQYSFIEQVPLEIAIVEWCESGSGDKGDAKKNVSDKALRLDGVEKKTESRSAPKAEVSETEIKEKPISEAQDERQDKDGDYLRDGDGSGSSRTAVGILTGSLNEEAWNKVLTAIRPGHASTEALLRAARPLEFDGSTLTVGVYYKFHKEHLEETHHRDILEKALSSYLGNSVKVVCRLTEPPVRSTSVQVENKPSDTDGGVVLTELEGEDLNVETSLTSEGGEDIISIAEKIFGS